MASCSDPYHYMNDIGFCEIAAASLGYSSGIEADGTFSSKPQGCYSKNGLIYFNYDTTFTDTSNTNYYSLCYCFGSECATSEPTLDPTVEPTEEPIIYVPSNNVESQDKYL